MSTPPIGPDPMNPDPGHAQWPNQSPWAQDPNQAPSPPQDPNSPQDPSSVQEPNSTQAPYSAEATNPYEPPVTGQQPAQPDYSASQPGYPQPQPDYPQPESTYATGQQPTGDSTSAFPTNPSDPTAAYAPVTGSYAVTTPAGPPMTGGDPNQPWAPVPPPKKSGGGKRLIVIAAAVVALAVAATLFFILRPSDAIQTSQGEIKNAASFLNTVRQTWRSSLPSEGVNIGPEAQCYYEVASDSNEVTGTIACGPVRRVGTGDGAVWDLFTFDAATTDSTGAPVARSLSMGAESMARPKGDLRDAEGNSPDSSADELAEPDLSPAEADLMLTDVDSAELTQTDVKKFGDEGRLISPEGTLYITSIGVVPSVVTDYGEPPLRAADGYKFLAITTTWEPNNEDAYEFNSKLYVDIDGEQNDITEGNIEPFLSGDPVITVVSVPEDGPAKLTISYAQHDQYFDLMTLERTPDPVADVLYRSETVQTLTASQSFGPVTLTGKYDTQDVTYTLTVDFARLVAHGGSKLGWAAPGTAWVVIHFEEEIDNDCCTFISDDPTYAGWTVSADGAAAVPASDAYLTNSYSNPGGYALFPVPSNVQKVSLSLTTNVNFTSFSSDDVAQDFGPLAVEINFPA